jgi:hypothetical protein
MDHSDLPRTSTLGPASVTPGGRGRVSSGSGSSSLRVSSSLRGTSSPFTPTGAGSEAPSVAATRIIRRFRNHIDIQGHKIKIAKPSSDDSCDGKVINVSDFNSTDSEAELVGKMRPTTPLPAAFNSTSSSVIEQDIESDYTFDDYEATPELNDILNRADTAAAVIHAASSSPAHQ